MKLFMFLVTLFTAIHLFAENPCAKIQNSVIEMDQATRRFKGCRLLLVEPHSVYSDLGLIKGDLVQPEGIGKVKTVELEQKTQKTETTRQ